MFCMNVACFACSAWMLHVLHECCMLCMNVACFAWMLHALHVLHECCMNVSDQPADDDDVFGGAKPDAFGLFGTFWGSFWGARPLVPARCMFGCSSRYMRTQSWANFLRPSWLEFMCRLLFTSMSRRSSPVQLSNAYFMHVSMKRFRNCSSFEIRLKEKEKYFFSVCPVFACHRATSLFGTTKRPLVR